MPMDLICTVSPTFTGRETMGSDAVARSHSRPSWSRERRWWYTGSALTVSVQTMQKSVGSALKVSLSKTSIFVGMWWYAYSAPTRSPVRIQERRLQ